MAQTCKDVYIVAATRTPIGKAPRGVFKDTRPDDLLVHAIASAMAQVPTLDPASINDAIVGCAFPEGEQGMNMARIAVLLAGPAQHGRWRHHQPLLRIRYYSSFNGCQRHCHGRS
jgi:acetyl-CoA acyltransferase